MAYSATKLDAAMGMIPTRNEIQTIATTGAPSGGNFALGFGDQTTANIAHTAAAADIDTALENLSNIPTGGVTCGGGPLGTAPVTVEFTGGLASTNVALMTLEDNNLTGGSDPDVAIAVSQTGYGAEKVAVNAGIDALGAIIDTAVTDAAISANEAEELYEMLYAFGEKYALATRDELT